MAITNYGYDGTLLEAGWSKLAKYLGFGAAIGSAGGFGVSAVAGVDRTVRVAAGEIYKSGVLVVNDANADVQASILASGTRWDTLVVRRDWQTNTTTLVIVAGTATKQLAAGLNASPGTIEDQPIALVQITAGQQAPTAVVDLRPLTVSADQSAIGTEKFWPAAGALPEGYVEEDGQALDRVKHSALFAIIGTTYGAGDGSTTFNVPNVKGRTLVGLDPAQAEFDTIGETGGAKTHTLTQAETPVHNHSANHGHSAQTQSAGLHNHMMPIGLVGVAAGIDHAVRSEYSASGPNTADSGTHGHTTDVLQVSLTTSNVGSGAAHNNLQPYAVRRVIIKAL